MRNLLSCYLLLLTWTTAPLAAQDRIKNWREDIDFLASELPKRHYRLFFKLTKADFEKQVALLRSDLPKLGDHQVEARLMQLVAGVGDGHTSVSVKFQTKSIVPLQWYWFKDGMYVTTATGSLAHLRGARLTHVGDVPFEKFTQRFKRFISHDSRSQLRNALPKMMQLGELLHAAGAWQSPGAGNFQVVVNGKPQKVPVKTISLKAARAAKWQTARKAIPLYARKARLPFWNDWLKDSGTLYFKYNQCANPVGFVRLTNGTAGFVRENSVKRFVLDIRNNGGGSSVIFAPLYLYLKTHKELNRKGRLFVIIGRQTFSSAVLNALDMKKTEAIFVGEPTGGRPNHYGEVRSIKLPHSKLSVRYSTKYFRRIKDADPESLQPDVLVEPTYADWVSGKDPVMEAVLSYGKKKIDQ